MTPTLPPFSPYSSGTYTARCVGLAVALLVLSIGTPSLADPAAIPDSAPEDAESSFRSFASSWMTKVQRHESAERSKPTVEPGASTPMVTYRGYGDDFSIELRPTGHASAPYVGLLRYEEHVYSCRSAKAENCSVASTIPVTEIFRFQNGSWNY